MTLADVSKEVLFRRQVWRFTFAGVGMPGIPVFEDNARAVHLAQNPITNCNSKDIELRHHFLRGLVRRNIHTVYTRFPFGMCAT